MINAKFIIEIQVNDIKPNKTYTTHELVDLIGATLINHGIKDYSKSDKFKTYSVVKKDVEIHEIRRIKEF